MSAEVDMARLEAAFRRMATEAGSDWDTWAPARRARQLEIGALLLEAYAAAGAPEPRRITLSRGQAHGKDASLSRSGRASRAPLHSQPSHQEALLL